MRQLVIGFQWKALQVSQRLRQFKIETANEFVDLVEALGERVLSFAPFGLRVRSIDAAALPRALHPFVRALKGLPRNFNLGANFVFQV